MSKYQPRINVNNPGKNVPHDIIDQFYLSLKTGNLDNIRDFYVKNNNKFSIITHGDKNDQSKSGKTPVHIILELDDKIADDDTKLRILKYLYQMGAPMDLPDETNVWPIHLAAASQSEELVDFLIEKKVSIFRKDSSNNTPLHYAISGKQIPCKISYPAVPIMPTTPSTINPIIKNINKELLKLINNNPILTENMIHIINTISNIPLMYSKTKFASQIETDIIEIFIDAANLPQNNLDSTQIKIEQLINRVYSTINDDILRGLTRELDIAPNNSGWGPQIPINPTSKRDPNNREKILPSSIDDQLIEIQNQVETKKLLLLDTNIIDKFVRGPIFTSINKIDNDYIDKLLFNSIYGEDVLITKALHLMLWNFIRVNYYDFFIDKLFDISKVMSAAQHSQIMSRVSSPSWTRNLSGYLFESDLDSIITDSTFDPVRNTFDTIMSKHSALFNNSCLGDQIHMLFTSSEDLLVDSKFNGAPPYNLHKTVFRTQVISKFLDDPFYSDLKPDITKFNSYFNVMSNNVFSNLSNVIKMIEPTTTDITPRSMNNWRNIFIKPATSPTTGVTFVLPKTPFPYNGPTGTVMYTPDAQYRYTFHELFQVLNSLTNYLLSDDPTGDYFSINDSPDIYRSVIADWDSYLDTIGSSIIKMPPPRTKPDPSVMKENMKGLTIQEGFPELMFVYRIVARHAQLLMKVNIKECLKTYFSNIIANTTLTTLDDFKTFIKPLNDFYLYGLLFPPNPDPLEMDITDPSKDPYQNVKSIKWDYNSSMTKLTSKYSPIIPYNLIKNLTDIIMQPDPTSSVNQTNLNYFNYDKFSDLRHLIEKSNVDNYDDIQKIINNKSFVADIRNYFTNTNDLVQQYHENTNTITLINQYSIYSTYFQSNTITNLFYSVEMVIYYFVVIKQHIINLSSEVAKISLIIGDIIAYVNSSLYYYIPQIFLPAMIKQIISGINYLLQIKNEINQFSIVKNMFNITNQKLSNINSLLNEFNTSITSMIETIYDEINGLIKYHNIVIDYLNTNSSYSLVNSNLNTISGKLVGVSKLVFTMNLVPFELLPPISLDTPIFSELVSNLNMYQIPQITYHGDNKEKTRINYTLFDSTDYRADIISYQRASLAKVSNSPDIGLNLQHNIFKASGLFDIENIKDAIEGKWLYFVEDPTNPNIFSLEYEYFDAFIAYDNKSFNYDWLNGMPSSIKMLLSPYLKIIKQFMIQTALQLIIDNYAKTDTDISKDKILTEIYDNLKSAELTNATDLDNVKINIIIAKLLDNDLNNIMEYSIRQSITNWIYNIIENDNIDYLTIVSKDKHNLKLKLTNIVKTIGSEIIPKKNININVNFEKNPDQIKYSTQQTPTDFINYLYNINYVSQGNLNKDKNCYMINPELVTKLIDGQTINSKNSDGNTPLHQAIFMNHSELVDILISKGANPTGFTNNFGHSAMNIASEMINTHLDYTQGTTVIDTINNFVIPFNDMLLSRIKEKYAPNIIKNITLAIPIQLVIYNHMFYNYLQNYRFNFSIELKTAIDNMIKKYYSLTLPIYPMDLFDITNKREIENVTNLQPDNEISNSTDKKLTKYQNEIKMINNQLDGLNKELKTSTDSDQIIFINNLITSLQSSKVSIEAQASSIVKPISKINMSLVSAYPIIVENIATKINRNLDITQFYNYAFNRIGKDKQLHLNIWNNYLQKNIDQTPSMIFPLLNGILKKIIDNNHDGKINNELKTEINNIVEFYSLTSAYINSKNPLGIPDDDPALKEELEQLGYLINLILTPTIYEMLIGYISQGIIQMDDTSAFFRDKNEIFDELGKLEHNNQTIEKYLTNILPKLAVKYYTLVYDNRDDVDRKYTNAEDLFDPILQIIKQTRIISLDDNSELIKNLKSSLIPYMASIYQNFIHHLRLSVYGYEKYIANTYTQIKIMQSLFKNLN